MDKNTILENNQAHLDISNILNEPAIFRITGYMNVLGILLIIIGSLIEIMSIFSIATPSAYIPQFKKTGWILILIQIFPLITGIGIAFTGYFLKKSGSRFQKFLYFKNISEFNIGLEYQRKYFLINLILIIFIIVSFIISLILSFALLGSIMSNYQLIN